MRKLAFVAVFALGLVALAALAAPAKCDLAPWDRVFLAHYDSLIVADQTARVALPALIADMQAARREVEFSPPPLPGCDAKLVADLYANTTAWMRVMENAFLSFAGGGDAETIMAAAFDEGDEYLIGMATAYTLLGGDWDALLARTGVE